MAANPPKVFISYSHDSAEHTRTLSRDRPIGPKRQQVVFREKVYSRL